MLQQTKAWLYRTRKLEWERFIWAGGLQRSAISYRLEGRSVIPIGIEFHLLSCARPPLPTRRAYRDQISPSCNMRCVVYSKACSAVAATSTKRSQTGEEEDFLGVRPGLLFPGPLLSQCFVVLMLLPSLLAAAVAGAPSPLLMLRDISFQSRPQPKTAMNSNVFLHSPLKSEHFF